MVLHKAKPIEQAHKVGLKRLCFLRSQSTHVEGHFLFSTNNSLFPIPKRFREVPIRRQLCATQILPSCYFSTDQDRTLQSGSWSVVVREDQHNTGKRNTVLCWKLCNTIGYVVRHSNQEFEQNANIKCIWVLIDITMVSLYSLLPSCAYNNNDQTLLQRS